VRALRSASGRGLYTERGWGLVWEYCDAALSTEEIAREVASLLPKEPQAYSDGLAVIAQLLEAGLLEIRSDRVSAEVVESESPNADE